MTGSGGWPLNVFLTPEQVPFYAGTYFPPQPRQGMPSWPQVLEAVAEAWDERRDEIRAGGERVARQLRGGALLSPSAEPMEPGELDHAVETLRSQYDPANGGFGGAPKFPPASALEFLLRRGETDMSAGTLRAMASGGMYDQIGGGFARYSVDPYWLVPHFEKMLYDNALLARAYLHGWLTTARRAVPGGLRGDARLGVARDARPRGRLLLRPRRGLRGRGGQVLRVDGRRAAPGPHGAARRRRGDRLVRRHRPRKLRGQEHPRARARPAGAAPGVAPHPPGGSLRASLARARRQAPDLVERADDLRPRGGGRGAGAARLPGRGSHGGRLRAGRAAGRRRPAVALVEGRQGQAERLPRGPRIPARGPAHALRGELRAALVRRGACAGGRDDRAFRR